MELMLNILGDLQGVVTRIMSRPDHVQYTHGNTNEEQGERDKPPAVLFSVTTEGSLHEMWVHYQLGEAYHMTCHRAWRTARLEDAREFVQALAKIDRVREDLGRVFLIYWNGLRGQCLEAFWGGGMRWDKCDRRRDAVNMYYPLTILF